MQESDEYSELAHHGERILVTRGGQPWVLLSPPVAATSTESTTRNLAWPDFAARVSPRYLKPSAGPTAAELLAQDEEDRF